MGDCNGVVRIFEGGKRRFYKKLIKLNLYRLHYRYNYNTYYLIKINQLYNNICIVYLLKLIIFLTVFLFICITIVSKLKLSFLLKFIKIFYKSGQWLFFYIVVSGKNTADEGGRHGLLPPPLPLWVTDNVLSQCVALGSKGTGDWDDDCGLTVGLKNK